MKPLITLVLLFLNSNQCLGAKILAVIPTPSYSHQIVHKQFFKELSLRGHQVTVITTDPVNDKSLTNITEIDVNFAYKILRDEMVNLMEARKKNIISYLRAHLKVFDTIISKELEHPEVQKLIHDQSQHFDLVIVEMMHQAMFALSKRFDCPSIGVTSVDGFPVYYEYVGNPTHPLKVINTIKTRFSKTSILGKLEAYFHYLVSNVLFKDLTASEEIVKKYFGKDYLPLRNILDNIDMIFLNSDNIFYPVEKTTPVVVRYGGETHISSPKPLPSKLQTILDNSTTPVIYFSLGSNVNSKDLPLEKRNAILQTFAEIPYTILWKFELDELPGKPDNVHISEWFPQQDILRHPNVKLFVTHCGLQSLGETIHFKVPVICIPIFAEQHDNAERMYQRGVGLQIDIETFTKDDFKKAIHEVIGNLRYQNRITELSNLVKDEPMTGLEKQIWWTEYVIRNKGAKHLRSYIDKYSFYEYYLLDIYAALLIVLILVLLSPVIVWKLSFRIITSIFSSKKKRNKKYQ